MYVFKDGTTEGVRVAQPATANGLKVRGEMYVYIYNSTEGVMVAQPATYNGLKVRG